MVSYAALMAASLRLAISMNSAGTPRAHQLVGMVVGDQLAVLRLDLGAGGFGAEPQDVEGLAEIGDEARAEEAELARREAEAAGDGGQDLVFLGMQDAVGGSDVQQAFQDVLQQLAVVLEQPGDLVGIGLEAGGILLARA